MRQVHGVQGRGRDPNYREGRGVRARARGDVGPLALTLGSLSFSASHTPPTTSETRSMRRAIGLRDMLVVVGVSGVLKERGERVRVHVLHT